MNTCTCTHMYPPLHPQIMNCQWMYNNITSNTTEVYQAHPFGWGGGSNTVKFVGPDAAREELLQRAQVAFEGHDWFTEEKWPEEMETCYRSLLRTYYSMPAVRLHAVANGVNTEGIIASSSNEKLDIIDRYAHARTPAVFTYTRTLAPT